jgi:hypothetical protein
VGGIEHDTVANGLLNASLGGTGRVETLDGLEDYRMVGDNHIAPLLYGLVNHLLGDIYRKQYLAHLIVISANNKARIIVRLLQRQWRKSLNYGGYFSYFHIL